MSCGFFQKVSEQKGSKNGSSNRSENLRSLPCVAFQVLNNPSYKNQAKKIGSALSPWKEMVDPVTRLVKT